MSSLTLRMQLVLMLPRSPCQDLLSVLWSRPIHRHFASPQCNPCGYRADMQKYFIWIGGISSDILSCWIWLTSVAITELILVLQTIPNLVICETSKESHVSSLAVNHVRRGSGPSCVAGEAELGSSSVGLLGSLGHVEPH